jgi:hypothetical protein
MFSPSDAASPKTQLDFLAMNWEVDSKGFCRRCISLRITGFVDFVHLPLFEITKRHNVSELDLFRSSVEEGGTATLLGPLERTNSVAG